MVELLQELFISFSPWMSSLEILKDANQLNYNKGIKILPFGAKVWTKKINHLGKK